jgi:cobalt/nickel transport system ATP-binding protein
MIRIDSLSFTYPDGTKALDGLSLRIEAGESVGIIGANGAGKSTLVNHLNGYFLPQQGTVRIGDLIMGKQTQEAIRRNVGVVFQNPDDQLFTARLHDDVAFGPENLGVGGPELESLVEKILRDLNLWEFRNKPPSHLSQGQKRFSAFATVLAMRPAAIVMDEPTSDLDPRNRRKLISLVNELRATRVTVSHDLDFVWETCGRVLLMSNGRIVADGPAHELLANRDMLQTHGLELPLRLQ